MIIIMIIIIMCRAYPQPRGRDVVAAEVSVNILENVAGVHGSKPSAVATVQKQKKKCKQNKQEKNDEQKTQSCGQPGKGQDNDDKGKVKNDQRVKQRKKLFRQKYGAKMKNNKQAQHVVRITSKKLP